MGRPLPPAPGGRRLHDAGQGPRWRAHGGAGPRDRRGRRRLRRRPRRQRRCSATATPTSPPARPSRSTGSASRTCPASGSASPTSGSPRCRPAATRPATSCAARSRASTPRRSSTRCPIARAISDFFTGNREYANLPRKFKMSVTGAARTAPRPRSTTSGCGRRGRPTGPSGSTCWSAAGSPTASAWPRTSTCSCGPSRPSRSPGPSPSSSASSATGRTGAWPGCGTSSRSSAPRGSGPSWRPAPASTWSRPARSSPAATGVTTSGVHPQAGPGPALRGVLGAGRPDVGHRARRGRPPGPDLRGRHDPARDRPELRAHRGARGPGSTPCSPRSCWPEYSPFPGPFERGVVACTGSEFCRFAVVETKERAVKWARWLDQQLADEPVGASAPAAGVPSARREDAGVIRMHFSGCSASCAQPQIADIGFRGDVAHVGEHIVEAVDIGMGGSLGPDAGFIDWIENARPVDDVPDALLRTVRRYQSERREDEPFYNWARRVPNESWRPPWPGSTPTTCQWEPVKGFRIRDEMNGIAEPPGQDLVLGARGRRHRRRPLHPVRHVRGRVPVQLDRRQRGQRSARAGEDVHRMLAVLGLLPPRRAPLRGAVAAVDRRSPRPARSPSS